MDSKTGTSGEGLLWGGRFTQATGMDKLMEKFNASLPVDRAMWKQDIKASIAYARANVSTGILTADEFKLIETGLQRIANEWESDSFVVDPHVDEDIHTANERRLTQLIGRDTAGKLHTGRSRNDQVVTDLRIWLRDRLCHLRSLLVNLLTAFTQRARREISHIMPGYTHLQRAQPVRWSHWLMSYATFFMDDLYRLVQVNARVNRSPLGCGALAGNAFGIDRLAISRELDFTAPLLNSMAAVSDRDFILDTLYWGSMIMLHLSRWSEDLILYSTAEFAFVRLSDAYSTGSSLMPQKKNCDSLELLRGKSGRCFGHLTGLMMTIKGLPSTYNKDLQESVSILMEHLECVEDSVKIATGVITTLAIDANKMRAAVTPDMLATELAEYLVRKGVPFRESHHTVGRVIAFCEQNNRELTSLTLDDFKAIDHRFDDDAPKIVGDIDRAVEMKNALGGTSKSAVMYQIDEIEKQLETFK